MSVRSSRRELAVAVALVITSGACGKKGPKKPEADPAQVAKLAAIMLRNVPTPAAVPDCTDPDFVGAVPITWRSLTVLGGEKVPSRPEDEAWINPPELDAPSIRALLDSKDKTAARQAAAEVLAA